MQKELTEKLTKPYNPTETESRIYALWEKSGYFNPDNLKNTSVPFTIIMPPPNANGNLHAGHALFITLEDIIIRYKRMCGYKALWVPGADHAGFETQVVYEKKLEKEGRSRFGMDPDILYKEILAFTLENKKNMEAQVKSLGASCDWSRERFTLDPDIVQKVQETFIKMYTDKLAYRGKRIVNWCSKHQTSLSDVETESVEEPSKLYYLQYGPFEIATARPETKFGDKYVVMHPDDTRYSQWKHGDKIEVEWINGPIEATIIKDAVIDKDFGTGVMTITPWHSQVDFELAEKYHLDMEQIIDWQGKLLPIAGEFAGQKIAVAREKIMEKLQAKGLVTKIDDTYTHVVKHCYKCNTIIEPQVKDQWFVKMQPLAKMALESVDRGEVTFIPDNYEKIFRYWMENTIDWNISRQIVWGIPIPAWLCDDCGTAEVCMTTKEGAVPTCPTCGKPMRRDTDTFDTWFSSGQWPLLTLNYPNGIDFKTFYPTDVMETGSDLIFKWVPRMVIFGLYLAKLAPFHTVYLHGLVNDEKGKKMSKSKGNVVNPLDLTATYGTDALRMALIVGNTPGTSLALAENKIKAYKNFANKIWNITRFILENTTLQTEKPILTEHDENCLKFFEHSLVREVTKEMEGYKFYLAAEKLYAYVWHTLADEIIEESKATFKEGDQREKSSRAWLLQHILQNSLKMLHPFMPFITEELWTLLNPSVGGDNLLMVTRWPTVE